MRVSSLISWLKPRWSSLSCWSDLDLCRQVDHPGVGAENARLVDFANAKTTVDQQRIEAVLDGLDLAGKRLLHVGVGDSGLALRFHKRCQSIDGLTIAERELMHGTGLGLPNYRIHLLNKYGRDFLTALQPGYDLIIDNNLASFVCCAFHYARMMDHYRWALARHGEILTDQRGMGWVVRDRRWRMTYDDLAKAGARFGLQSSRVTEDVYALRRVA